MPQGLVCGGELVWRYTTSSATTGSSLPIRLSVLSANLGQLLNCRTPILSPLIAHLPVRAFVKRLATLARPTVLFGGFVAHAVLGLVTPRPAQAIIFYGSGDPAFNATQPTGILAGSGWQYSGSWVGATAVAVAPNWILTARHIGDGASGDTFTLTDGTSFTSVMKIESGPGLGGDVDLTLVKLNGAFNNYAPLYTGSNEKGKDFTVFGRGGPRGAEVRDGGNILHGWLWNSSDGVMRWGENNVATFADWSAIGDELLLRADFNRNPSSPTRGNEATVSPGDSGGGLFINDGGIWKLAGINYGAEADFNTTNSGAGFRAAMFDKGGYYVPGSTPGTWLQVPDLAADKPASYYASRISKNLAFITQTIGLSNWNIDASSNWNNAAAWAGGYVPNGVDNTATFLNATTGARTITVTAPVTLGTIDFHHAASYTIAGASAITLSAAASPAATIRVRSGDHTISAPLTVQSALNLDVQQGSLKISGAVGNAGGRAITKIGGGDLVISGAQNHAPGSMLNVNGGSLALEADGGGNLTVNANATTFFGTSQQLAALHVGGSAVATVAPGNNKTLALDALSVALSGRLDLRDNALIVHATSLTKNATLASITADLARAFNGGLWNSSGIGSFNAANDGTHRTALGVLLNDRGDGQPIHSMFGGIAATATDILVAYTYYGDSNLDGLVDGTDYAFVDNGYNLSLSGWRNGDFNYDGVVDGTDFALIDNAFNTQTVVLGANYPSGPAAGSLGLVTVPEPSMAILAAISMFVVGCRAARRSWPRSQSFDATRARVAPSII